MKFELVEIKKIDTYEVEEEIVYDISVEEDTSFCVEDNIVVHNSACTTRNATGIYHPKASLLMECKEAKDKYGLKSLIIADGGIKEPSDFCKAIACGADVVMVGSVIASAIDSPAELIKRDNIFYKVYHGSASFEIQKLYKEKPKYIEGRTALLPFNNETLEQIVMKFKDGLRSCMSYFDARNIEEFHENCKDCIVYG